MRTSQHGKHSTTIQPHPSPWAPYCRAFPLTSATWVSEMHDAGNQPDWANTYSAFLEIYIQASGYARPPERSTVLVDFGPSLQGTGSREQSDLAIAKDAHT